MTTMVPKVRAGLYYRVSTRDQSHGLQLDELRLVASQRGYSVTEYVDVGSGSGKKLPERERLMAEARAGRLDVVVCWRFDRFARSTRDLLDALESFCAWNVSFMSLREGIDTSTATGRLVFTMVGAIAEFERELIRERVRAGIDAARRRGQRLGRPPRDVKVDAVAQRLAAGEPLRQIARSIGVPPRTLRRALGGGAKTCASATAQDHGTTQAGSTPNGRSEK